MSGQDNVSYTVRTLVGQAQQQTLRDTDRYIIWRSGGFAIYTLPRAADFPGRQISFIVHDQSAGAITVFPATGDTGNGEVATLSWDITGFTGRLDLISDGVNGWWSTASIGVTRF